MLNGSRMINAIELKRISDFLGVSMEELTRIQAKTVDTDIVHAFMGKVNSEQAKNALAIADKLSERKLKVGVCVWKQRRISRKTKSRL